VNQVYRFTGSCLKPPKPPLGTVQLIMRQHHAVEVSPNATDGLEVYCSMCNKAWHDVKDETWPTQHAAHHDEEAKP
jgi:hypothetical protein